MFVFTYAAFARCHTINTEICSVLCLTCLHLVFFQAASKGVKATFSCFSETPRIPKRSEARLNCRKLMVPASARTVTRDRGVSRGWSLGVTHRYGYKLGRIWASWNRYNDITFVLCHKEQLASVWVQLPSATWDGSQLKFAVRGRPLQIRELSRVQVNSPIEFQSCKLLRSFPSVLCFGSAGPPVPSDAAGASGRIGAHGIEGILTVMRSRSGEVGRSD